MGSSRTSRPRSWRPYRPGCNSNSRSLQLQVPLSDTPIVLLLQIRSLDDPMAAHEIDCVARRLRGSRRDVALRTRNALTERARTDWLADVDALIIGGSGDFSVHHPNSRAFVDPLRDVLDLALSRGMPGFGICFGHQLVGLHLGGEVRTAPEHAEIGTVHAELTESGATDPLFGAMRRSFRVQSGHSDSVVKAPNGVDVLASSDRLATQAFRVRGTDFYTAQFHPDLTGEEARARYLAYKVGFAKSNVGASDEDAEKFVVGADDASALLGRFVDHVMDGL